MGLLKKETGAPEKVQHLAITTDGIRVWAAKHKVPVSEAYSRSNELIMASIRLQVAQQIPFMTFFVLRTDMDDSEHFPRKIDALVQLFAEVEQVAAQHGLKVTCLGKWYDLPSRLVESIKRIIDMTKDNTNFYTNFCVNYRGREEIVDACKIIAMQVKTEKIAVDAITQEDVQDNLYVSGLIPPSLIIKNGTRQKIPDLLLWDCVGASIFFTGKYWPDVEMADIEKAVDDYAHKKI